MTLMTMMNGGDEAAIAEAKKENKDIFNVKKSEWERRRGESLGKKAKKGRETDARETVIADEPIGTHLVMTKLK